MTTFPIVMGRVGDYPNAEAGRILQNRKPYLKRIAVIGSSLTAHNTEFNAGSYIGHSTRGWLPWANMLLGGRVDFDIYTDRTSLKGMNKGVAGEYTSQILARVGQVASVNPDAVIVQAGTNDIASVYDYAAIIANLERIHDYFLNRGITLIVAAEFTRTLSTWAAGSVERKKLVRVNNWKRQYAKENAHRGALFVDMNKYIIDPASADGAPYSNMFYDGTHLHPQGAYKAALALKEVLEPLVPPASPQVLSQADLYDATYNPFGNYLANGLFTGTGGGKGTGVTGNVATGWQVERVTGAGTASVVASLVPRTDVPGGYYQQVVITPSGVGTTESVYVRTSPATGTTPPDAVWLQAGADVQIDSGQDCLLAAAVEVMQSTSVWTYKSQYPYDVASQYLLPNAAMSLTHATPPLLSLASEGGFRYRFRVDVKATGASPVTLRIGGAWLRQVGAPE